MRRKMAAFTAADGGAAGDEHDAEEERALAAIQRASDVSRTRCVALTNRREAAS